MTTCDGYPQLGCDNEATCKILGWDLCDDCTKAFIAPPPAPIVLTQTPLDQAMLELTASRDAAIDRADAAHDALAEARAQIEEARALILQAVELMTPEQVGQWGGVRTWLEKAVQ
jgi:outer membrane protein TolC